MNIQKIFRKLKLNKLKKKGLIVGERFKMEKGSVIDPSFPWLVNIGNDVTLAPRVYILSHDGSSKPFLDLTRIGKVTIGNNVFIGAATIILPNVNIGSNVIIGAGSIVNRDIPDNCVYAGNPAKYLMPIEEYIIKNQDKIKGTKSFDRSYTQSGKIDKNKKKEMINELKDKMGYID